jgi:uncharacterized ubiquitin-like protein YukD
MMSSTVVVSVQYSGGLRRDLELPVNIPVATLAANIAQAIHSIDEGQDVRAFKCMLRRMGTGEVLKRDRSLADYAIVHGEILELIQQALPTRAIEIEDQPRFNGPGFLDSSGLVFELAARKVLVGRANPKTGELDSAVHLDLTTVDTVGAPSVSERQAEIALHGDQFLIRDLSSGGGTVVNLKPLVNNQPVVLRHGDHVSFGDVKLVFVWDGRNLPAI